MAPLTYLWSVGNELGNSISNNFLHYHFSDQQIVAVAFSSKVLFFRYFSKNSAKSKKNSFQFSKVKNVLLVEGKTCACADMHDAKNASPKEKMKRSSTFVVNFEHVCSKFAASAGKTGIGNSHIVKMRIEIPCEIRDIGIFVSFCMYR